MELEIMHILGLQMIFVYSHLNGKEHPGKGGARSHAHKWHSRVQSDIRSWPYLASFVPALKFLEGVLPRWLEL